MGHTPEFAVNEAWVENEAGERVIDFDDHCYHVWIYSQSYDGVLSRDELLEHIATLPEAPDLIPMRQSYYREKWGLPGDYPMVAPGYSKQRSMLAKQMGLGKSERD